MSRRQKGKSGYLFYCRRCNYWLRQADLSHQACRCGKCGYIGRAIPKDREGNIVPKDKIPQSREFERAYKRAWETVHTEELFEVTS